MIIVIQIVIKKKKKLYDLYNNIVLNRYKNSFLFGNYK